MLSPFYSFLGRFIVYFYETVSIILQGRRLMETLTTPALPEFAPLSEPFVRFLFDLAPHNRYLPPDLLPSEADRPIQIRRAFLHARVYAYDYSAPRATDSINNEWVAQGVRQFYPGVERRTPRPAAIHDWQARGLLRYQSRGKPELNSASAIFILRNVSTTQRDWLPARVRPGEPHFYVWGIRPGESHPVVYPLPLPTGIAANTLLYSPWPGVPWSFPAFRTIQCSGSIGWAGYNEERGQYTLSWEQIDCWSRLIDRKNPALFPENLAVEGVSPLPNSNTPYAGERKHTCATELLYLIGEQQLCAYFARNDSISPRGGKESALCPMV
jgi:hypothetical protein